MTRALTTAFPAHHSQLACLQNEEALLEYGKDWYDTFCRYFPKATCVCRLNSAVVQPPASLVLPVTQLTSLCPPPNAYHLLTHPRSEIFTAASNDFEGVSMADILLSYGLGLCVATRLRDRAPPR